MITHFPRRVGCKGKEWGNGGENWRRTQSGDGDNRCRDAEPCLAATRPRVAADGRGDPLNYFSLLCVLSGDKQQLCDNEDIAGYGGKL